MAGHTGESRVYRRKYEQSTSPAGIALLQGAHLISSRWQLLGSGDSHAQHHPIDVLLQSEPSMDVAVLTTLILQCLPCEV